MKNIPINYITEDNTEVTEVIPQVKIAWDIVWLKYFVAFLLWLILAIIIFWVIQNKDYQELSNKLDKRWDLYADTIKNNKQIQILVDKNKQDTKDMDKLDKEIVDLINKTIKSKAWVIDKVWNITPLTK
jgi:ABC-type multidrug transport system fused ATPase/permease subunit